MQIENKTFIVTGGSSGLGEAVVRHLNGKGACVAIADVNEERGIALADELGDKVRFFQTDITNENNAQETIDTTHAVFGSLNGLINCAGVAVADRVLGKKGVHALSAFDLALKVNLLGTFNMIRLCAQKLETNEPLDTGERGVIINTASVAAYEGQIGQAAYAASKGGVVSMTVPLARELAAFGIRVLTIAPGIFRTPMMDVLPEEVQVSLGKAVPFPSRLGEPNEFAELVQHMIENCMLNGETVRLDGAIRLTAK